MGKIKIKINIYGCLPFSFDLSKIKKFKSSVFEVVGNVNHLRLPECSNGVDYVTIEDKVWEKVIKNDDDVDLVFSITNAYLEGDFYSRRLSEKRVIFSFALIRDFLKERYISLENVILKELYMYSLYLMTGEYDEKKVICHNDTRGCMYDMDGDLRDVAETFYNPSICRSCEEFLSQKGVPENEIQGVQQELAKLKPALFYRILCWVKEHPVWALFFTFLGSVISDILASIVLEILL